MHCKIILVPAAQIATILRQRNKQKNIFIFNDTKAILQLNFHNVKTILDLDSEKALIYKSDKVTIRFASGY